MIYIHKGEPPRSISLKVAAIKREARWRELPDESPKRDEGDARRYTDELRTIFDEFPKGELREAVLREQHHLCACCMRRIHNDGRHMRIEHWYPLSHSKYKAIDYSNMLGVCKGSDYQNQRVHACCDANKGGKVIKLDPRDERMMSQIRYESSGRIYFEQSGGWTEEEVCIFQKDIDEILMLNGESATSEQSHYVVPAGDDLKSMRQAVYKGCRDTFKRLVCNNKLTVRKIQEMINKIESKEVYDEFVGVKLFYFKRWIKKQKRQGY